MLHALQLHRALLCYNVVDDIKEVIEEVTEPATSVFSPPDDYDALTIADEMTREGFDNMWIAFYNMWYAQCREEIDRLTALEQEMPVQAQDQLAEHMRTGSCVQLGLQGPLTLDGICMPCQYEKRHPAGLRQIHHPAD